MLRYKQKARTKIMEVERSLYCNKLGKPKADVSASEKVIITQNIVTLVIIAFKRSESIISPLYMVIGIRHHL